MADGDHVAAKPELPVSLATLAGGYVLTLAGHIHAIFQAIYPPGGRRIATASHDQMVQLWDAATGPAFLSLILNGREVTAFAFASDDRRIVRCTLAESSCEGGHNSPDPSERVRCPSAH